MEEQVRARIIVKGRVQGVFFRLETQRAARRYGVYGWVRNRRDGSVEALMEGGASAVGDLVEWCKQGPPRSIVEQTDVVWEAYKGEFADFGVRY